MTTKSVNTDAARYRALRREEVMVSMTHDGNTGSTPWLEGDELDKCADSLLAATPLEPFIEQAQPEAITDAVMQVYHRTSVGDALDYSDIYDAVKAVLAAPVAAQAQPVTVGEALESARWRNALVGLCDTDRIDSPEQAIANVKRRMRPMGLTQQPSSGADTDVRKILLDVVPGLDGMGHEVYAKSVGDVEKALTKMAQELEEWELGIRRHPDATLTYNQVLEEAANTLEQRRNLLMGQNVVLDIQEGVALYNICIEAVRGLMKPSENPSPVDDKSHPRFLAGYDAGMKDAKRPKPGILTPLGVLVLKYFELLDRALDLDKSPSAWVHKPKGSPQERMAAWQEVHAVRREIKEFIG